MKSTLSLREGIEREFLDLGFRVVVTETTVSEIVCEQEEDVGLGRSKEGGEKRNESEKESTEVEKNETLTAERE